MQNSLWRPSCLRLWDGSCSENVSSYNSETQNDWSELECTSEVVSCSTENNELKCNNFTINKIQVSCLCMWFPLRGTSLVMIIPRVWRHHFFPFMVLVVRAKMTRVLKKRAVTELRRRKLLYCYLNNIDEKLTKWHSALIMFSRSFFCSLLFVFLA